jgi:DNA mismatch repair ATPase MutS
MKVHLLHKAQDFDFGAQSPPQHEDLAQDLELATLLKAMAAGDRFLFGVSEKVLLASLGDPEAIRYRQRVLRDCIAQPEVIREMYSVAFEALEDKRRVWGYYGVSVYPSAVLSGAVTQLEASFARLKQLRKIADAHADDFRSDGLTTLFRTLQRELDDEYLEQISYHLRQLRFRRGELISAALDRDNSGIDFVLRSPRRSRPAWREYLRVGPRSSYTFTIPPQDHAGGEALAEITGRGINLAANAAAQSADHILSYFTTLRAELGFFVSCLNLRGALMAKGVPVAFPEASPPRPVKLSMTDLRDVSLVLLADTPVVGNHVDADGKPLVIITGANSGGKSTFLRSVGQAQLMMQCGMFVAAETYRASVSSGVFTHFIREEDGDMQSGRLDEELSRMSTIADQIRPHSLALFNESFAATNEREGSEIGRQVVQALLDAQMRVFFVTHQYDFADGYRRQRADSTLFLRAERQPDGRRDYKLIMADPLPTSFGEDLYYQLGGWLDEEDAPEVAAALGE